MSDGRRPDHVTGLDYNELQDGLTDAERATGITRILRMALGVVLVMAGIAMLVLPGQGVLTIIIGLNLIKPDNPMVRWLRQRTPGIPDDGPIPTRIVWAGIAMFVVMTALSLLLGPALLDWARDQI